MLLTFVIIIAVVFLAYCWLIFSFIKGWDSLPIVHDEGISSVKLSCIIPFRNEARNLKQLVYNLINQDFSEDYFEVLFVDDHSTDESFVLLEGLIRDVSHFKLLRNQGCGKKAAIGTGVDQAIYHYMVTSDADCIQPPKWLSSISSYLNSQSVDLLIGPVAITYQPSYLHKFQSIDFLSLITSGAGACGVQKPIMCNGANLVYKKELYQKVNSFIHNKFASGDDIFLLQYAKKIGANICFFKCKHAIVTTNPVETIGAFFSQRVRWASKSKGYTDGFTLYVAWLVFLCNMLVAFVPFILLLSKTAGVIAFIGCVLKAVIDYRLLKAGANFFSIPLVARQFISVQLIYPYYILATVAYSLKGTLYWKGREI